MGFEHVSPLWDMINFMGFNWLGDIAQLTCMSQLRDFTL